MGGGNKTVLKKFFNKKINISYITTVDEALLMYYETFVEKKTEENWTKHVLVVNRIILNI